MPITSGSAVAIDYTLTDDEGTVIDTSEKSTPLWYLHGHGNIVPGLERELTGREVGDRLQVSIEPADGYGEWDEVLAQQVEREQFADFPDLSEGMQFQVETEDGPLVFTVVEVDDNFVKIDGNHPLAGATLNFDVTVREIRMATAEELEHGHVHEPGGHEH